MDAISGIEPGAPYSINSPERPFLKETRINPEKLRIGFHTRSAYGREVHPECIKAVEHACKLLESLGHEVEETTPNFQEEEVALNWCIILIGNTAAQVDKLVQVYGSSDVKRKIELLNYAMYSRGKQMKTLDFMKARRKWREFGLIMDQLFSKYDMRLTPTLGEPPILVGSLKPNKSDLFSMKLIRS
jgi:amidase